MIFHQGDILKVNLNPTHGHEQAGYRPVIVLQNTASSLVLESTTIVLPITTSKTDLPFEVKLDERTKTTGKILCRQIRAVDLRNRNAEFIEHAPEDIIELCGAYVSALIKKDE